MRKTGWFRCFCEWGARRALARLHRVTHRMPVELREVQKGRVLVIAPHIDDEVIGPGGTLALHKDAGSTIGVVYVSNSAGDPGQTGSASQTEIRKREGEACAQALGFEIVAFLDFPDGNLSKYEDRIAGRLAEIITSWQPTQIVCPFPTDHHRDHQASVSALALAIRKTNWRGEVWGFEVWSTIWPNVTVDISHVVERKQAGIACHASQIANMSYVEAALGLNRYRGLRVGVPFGEAFYVCQADAFMKLATKLLFRV